MPNYLEFMIWEDHALFSFDSVSELPSFGFIFYLHLQLEHSLCLTSSPVFLFLLLLLILYWLPSFSFFTLLFLFNLFHKFWVVMQWHWQFFVEEASQTHEQGVWFQELSFVPASRFPALHHISQIYVCGLPPVHITPSFCFFLLFFLFLLC